MVRPLDVPHQLTHLDLPDGRLQVLTAGDAGSPVLLLSGGVVHAVLWSVSQGRAVTLAYAIERPERVRRIVAMAHAGTTSFPPVLHQLLWLTARWSGPIAALRSVAFRSRPVVERFVRAALLPGPGQPTGARAGRPVGDRVLTP